MAGFEHRGTQGKVPRVFTGITPDGRQFIVEFDRLPFDRAKRRNFMIWLCQRYRVIAYAYGTRVLSQGESGQDPTEGLVIFASSFHKDVAARFSIVRNTNGSITYQQETYSSENATDETGQIFLGLHRPGSSPSAVTNEEFETTWATLEPNVFWQSVAARLDPDDPDSLVASALRLYASGNCQESIALGEKAADILRKQQRAQTAKFAEALVVQALCHRRLVNVAEAERLYRQAIEIYERVDGPNSSNVGITLDNLAALYADHGRLSEAEKLRLRALEIFRATFDPANPHIATTLQNLAVLYQKQGRFSEARAKFLEALPIAEKAYGPESRQVGIICDNLAGLNRVQRDFNQADRLYVRAISIFQKTLGRDHPDTALALQNHAVLLSETGRSEEAEHNLKEALAINERLYGTTHDSIASALNTLVLHYIEQKRWSDALALARRAATISVQLTGRGATLAPSEGGQHSSSFRRLVQAAYGAKSDDPEVMNEAFVSAQRALDTQAALALSQLAARYAAGDGALARLLRERQDFVAEMRDRDNLLIDAVARAPTQRDRAGEDQLKLRVEEISSRIGAIDQTLMKQFPEFSELSKAVPISIMETQVLLAPDEALLLFLDLQAVGDVGETGFAWLITKETAEWARLPIGTHALARSVAALRCGLDGEAWSGGGGSLCKTLLKFDRSSREWLPFDLKTAFDLYQALFGPFEAKIKNKHLLLVPTGALTGLPPSVLVVDRPAEALPASIESYRHAVWLGARQPITILPSVGALKSLRQFAKKSSASKLYLGIGNPLLDGPDPSFGLRAEIARSKQSCPKSPGPRMATFVAGGTKPLQQRGGLAPVTAIRAQVPLPETADELCGVARDLGVLDTDIWLGARATEQQIKRANANGQLATYRIIHFATHGALAGELQVGAEPGLILTPPRDATPEDDGYLSASEIASLKLDADWIILSACNTAAGGEPGAEAFSGLARAFFYAGARSLLVSHWAVDSDSTVRLITKALNAVAADKSIGRAEALRRAMSTMIASGGSLAAHPSNWAPFVVVGEGNATALVTTSSTVPPPAIKAPTTKPRRMKNPPQADWRKDIGGSF
jgi:CHAT domain-containing protein/tetratricopeptide (TPR) repeat protein